MPDSVPDASRPRNPLALPLFIVSIVAAAEAVALTLLVMAALRRVAPTGPIATGMGRPAPAVASTAAVPQEQSPAPNTDRPAAAATSAVARGKAGRRVDSGGFGVTVEKILHEPATYKDMVRVGDAERYIALLVAADNNTGANAQLYPSQFTLRDAAGFSYDPLGVKGTIPALEWTTLGNRQTVRGHVDFVVPKSAKNLELVYTGVPRDGAPIQIELGE